MSRIIKIFLAVLILTVLVLGWRFYPRLDILTGFAAKNVCSCLFAADRKLASVRQQDNNFVPVSYAANTVDSLQQTASASILGLKERTAVFEEGIGCILLPRKESQAKRVIILPERKQKEDAAPYPFGDEAPVPGLDAEGLKSAIAGAFEPAAGTRAVLVLYKDQLVAEEYAPGFTKDTRLLGWSMTKSITNAVLGVLEKQGRISLEQDSLFPQWNNDARAEIRLENLLQMNSGLAWNEDYTRISDVTKMLFLAEDMSGVQLRKPLTGKIGSTWNYSSGTTNLLSKFIRDQFKTRQEYLDFWYRELIDRIGMHSMLIETDLAGNFVGSSYAWATARDWAKFGLLFLHKGKWKGEQIVSEEWVEFSTTPTKDSKGEYGAHFWLNAGGKYPNVPPDLFSANGFQGQYVFIIPSRDLVVVRFGISEDAEFDVDSFISGIISSLPLEQDFLAVSEDNAHTAH